ncbi:MAG TPA: serine/threonine-protein kinase [Polyangiaceae bacterium]|nr:serine/threonine-protein kinase [Polyangiaceae bacterium]
MPSPSADAATSAWPTAGGYQPFVELGRGGMGAAFLARRCISYAPLEPRGGERSEPWKSPTWAVVKRPHPHLMKDSELHRRFHHEAALATSVRHPHLVETWGAGEDRSGPYLLLEYVHGTTLEDLMDRAALRGSDLPLEFCLFVAAQCLEALHALHHACDRRGTPLFAVHRDVSPQNVLVGVNGRARLSDLGVAKSRLRQASTDTRSVLGKITYLAPEYLRERRTGPHLDVYALGITLWTSIAGRVPFSGQTESARIASILEQGAPPLSSVVRRCPQELSDVVARATARDPRERIGVKDLRRELLGLVGERSGTEEIARVVQHLAGRDLEKRRSAWGLDASVADGSWSSGNR